MPRSVWIDAGNVPDPAKLSRYGITRPYFSIADPQVTRPFLDRWRGAFPDGVGVYVAASWYGDTPEELADRMDAWLNANAAGTGASFPRVQFNAESLFRSVQAAGGLPQFLTRLLGYWRTKRAQRETSIALDGFQGGLWNNRSGDVAAVNSARVTLVPEAYTGAPAPMAADEVRRDLELYGFTLSSLSIFRLGEDLPIRWDGFVFTQGRLP